MPAKICTVFNLKGGCGKSTLAVNLAYEFGKIGKALLVDLDSQSSSTDWVSRAPEDSPFPTPVINMSRLGRNAIKEIKKYVDDYDWIVIDCPPSNEQQSAIGAMLISDAVVLPTKPNPPDLWATDSALSLIEEIKITNETLKVLIMGSQVKNTNLNKDIFDEIRNTEGVVVLDNFTSDLTSYAESPFYGCGVTGLNSRHKKAAVEFKAIFKEIKMHIEANDGQDD